MPFNVQKWKVMHIGNNNVTESYSMGGKVLDKASEERDS